MKSHFNTTSRKAGMKSAMPSGFGGRSSKGVTLISPQRGGDPRRGAPVKSGIATGSKRKGSREL